MQLPIEIMDRYWNVTICGDIMFINKIPFPITISRHIKFGTSEMLVTRSAANIKTAIKNIQKVYKTRGFKIDMLMMDGEFESLYGAI